MRLILATLLPLMLGLAGCTLDALPSSPAGEPLTLAALAGRYDRDAAACAAPASEMRLVIAPDMVSFYESRCRVLSQRPAGAGVEAVLACTGEGSGWTETMTFTPTGSGGVAVLARDLRTTRMRCGG